MTVFKKDCEDMEEVGEEECDDMMKLKEAIQMNAKEFLDSFGVVFSFAIDQADVDAEEQKFLAVGMRHSLFDWVSANRRQLIARNAEQIEEYLASGDGKVRVMQREEIEYMVSPAQARIIELVEQYQHLFEERLLAERGGPDATGHAVAGGSSARSSEDATGNAVGAGSSAGPSEEELKSIGRKALLWTVCQRKMGFLDLAEGAGDGGATDDMKSKWEAYITQILGKWDDHCRGDASEVEPGDGEPKEDWISRSAELLTKLPRKEDGQHADWLEEEAIWYFAIDSALSS